MKSRIVILLLAALAAASSIFAETTLSNADAKRLLVALRTAQPGLTPTNTRNAALNINVLRPLVEAFEAAETSAQKKAVGLAKDPERDAKLMALDDEIRRLGREPMKVALVPFTVSDDEIKEAKIAADPLAEFIRFLTPAEKGVATK